jgi:hypothetical protein
MGFKDLLTGFSLAFTGVSGGLSAFAQMFHKSIEMIKFPHYLVLFPGYSKIGDS